LQTIYTDKIQLVDKKYFHKTQYAISFKMKFETDLLHNKIQFNTTYWTYKTIDEFNNLLSYYQISKIKTEKAINILEACKKHINSTIEKCYDKYCIEIYEYLINCYNESCDVFCIYGVDCQHNNWNAIPITTLKDMIDFQIIDDNFDKIEIREFFRKK